MLASEVVQLGDGTGRRRPDAMRRAGLRNQRRVPRFPGRRALRIAAVSPAVWIFGLALLWSAVDTRPAHGKLLFLQGWEELSPEQKRRALENYQMFQELDPGRRKDVEKNYQKWRRMPESKKERLRKNFERYRQMSPGEREDFDRKYRKWRRR